MCSAVEMYFILDAGAQSVFFGAPVVIGSGRVCRGSVRQSRLVVGTCVQEEGVSKVCAPVVIGREDVLLL